MYGQRIPVGLEAAAAVTRGTFSCLRCRHWQRAEVVGVGNGFHAVLGVVGISASRARAVAARDVQRTLRFAACPRCKHRSGHGAFVAPYVAASFAVIALAVILGCFAAHTAASPRDAMAFGLYTPLLVTAAVGVVTAALLLDRWKHNDERIRWLDF